MCPAGAQYDRRFEELAASGADMHGEAAFVESFGGAPCSTPGAVPGRVAIELGRRGHDVVGVDMDPGMLEAARRKAPELAWIEGDLADARAGCSRPPLRRRRDGGERPHLRGAGHRGERWCPTWRRTWRPGAAHRRLLAHARWLLGAAHDELAARPA